MVTAVSGSRCWRHRSQLSTARHGRSASEVTWNAVSSGTCDEVVYSSTRASVRKARKAQPQSTRCIFVWLFEYRGNSPDGIVVRVTVYNTCDFSHSWEYLRESYILWRHLRQGALSLSGVGCHLPSSVCSESRSRGGGYPSAQ